MIFFIAFVLSLILFFIFVFLHICWERYRYKIKTRQYYIEIYNKNVEIYCPVTKQFLGKLEHPICHYELIKLSNNEYQIKDENIFIKFFHL